MAETLPTASTLHAESPSKNGHPEPDEEQMDKVVESHKHRQKKVKTSHNSVSEANGPKGVENQLFVKASKDKHHDRKSRSGRKGTEKKGKSHYFVLNLWNFCLS